MRAIYLLKHKFLLSVSRVAFRVFQSSSYGSYTAQREATKRESA
jgi:hypothetical protein